MCGFTWLSTVLALNPWPARARPMLYHQVTPQAFALLLHSSGAQGKAGDSNHLPFLTDFQAQGLLRAVQVDAVDHRSQKHLPKSRATPESQAKNTTVWLSEDQSSAKPDSALFDGKTRRMNCPSNTPVWPSRSGCAAQSIWPS